MGTSVVNQNINPALSIKEIQDQYIRTNFKNLSQYFARQNQLLNYKFFELNFTAATASYDLVHGLGVLPQDLLMMNVVGEGQINFNFGLSTSSTLNISTTGVVRVRFLLGTYWNYQTSYQFKNTDVWSFIASPVSSSASTTTAGATTARNSATATTLTTSITVGDINLLDGSTGAFSAVLPTASKNDIVTIKRVDNNIGNAITLRGTIDNVVNPAIFTQNESYVIQWDGLQWRSLSHFAQTDWINVGLNTVTATGGGVTVGSTANPNRFSWKRNGRDATGRIIYQQTANTGAVDGTGTYKWDISPLVIDSNVVTPAAITNPLVSVTGAGSCLGGTGHWTNTTVRGPLHAFAYDTTHVTLSDMANLVNIQAGTDGGFNTNANMTISIFFNFAVPGWMP